jgi:thiol-disulfide isomerase/thioredoxin
VTRELAVRCGAVGRRVAAGLALGLVLGLVLLAGCVRGPGSARADGPSCLPPGAGPSGAVASLAPTGGGTSLPDLALACLDGGGTAHLARLGVPTVVNLWATWCGPCRQELPAFQRYAEQVGDRARVVGVVTGDTPENARSFAKDLGLRFPMLVDTEGVLMKRVGVAALPATLFVDEQGRVAFLHNGAALDQPALERLAAAHLQVSHA